MFVDLIEQAVAVGRLPECDPEQMAYVLAALNTAFVMSHTLGNDYGLALPDPVGLARRSASVGWGADRSSAAGLIDRLDFPTPSASRSQPGSKRRGGRGSWPGRPEDRLLRARGLAHPRRAVTDPGTPEVASVRTRSCPRLVVARRSHQRAMAWNGRSQSKNGAKATRLNG